MATNDKELVLDDAAEKLYRMLGGIDTSDRADHSSPVVSSADEGLLESLMEQEKQLDGWRSALIEIGHLVSSYFRNVRISGLTQATLNELNDVITGLAAICSQIPNHDNSLFFRFRGRHVPGETHGTENLDYLILIGNIMVDISQAKAISKKTGVTGSHLPGRISKTFQELALLDINNLRLTIGSGSQQDLDRLRLSMQILGQYFQQFGAASSKITPQAGDDGGVPIIYNENHQPDPNLSMLAGINKINRESLQEVVNKVRDMMNQPDALPALQQFTCAYDAIFAFKKFKDQLVKPLAEVNNARWLMVSRGQEVVDRDKVHLTKKIAGIFAASPQQTAKIMEALYGSDYRDIQPEDLNGNLHNIAQFLTQAKGLDNRAKQEAMGSIQKGLDRTPESLFDQINLKGKRFFSQSADGQGISSILPNELLDIVSFFKKRSVTKRKMQQMLHEPMNFDSQDLETIGRDFGISGTEAGHLVGVMKECFTTEGRFNRRVFENNIPEFLKFEKKVFNFLWHYLKEIKFRDDRVSFLNSLQLLIAKMTAPELALQVLLEDFVKTPGVVGFADRNALILANILLRKYNKELHNHIELTPEEVLLVQAGLNQKMTKAAADFIDVEHDRYLLKVRTLHKGLREAIQPAENTHPMPLRYLVTVEREIFILLALVGGDAAHKIMRSVVMEYGDPDSFIYTTIQNAEQMKAVFQLLQLTVRGLERFKDPGDRQIFFEIKTRREDFLQLNKQMLTQESVDRVMEFVSKAMQTISSG